MSFVNIYKSIYFSILQNMLIISIQSEVMDPHDMRREFLTGFTGSTGEAVVTVNKAVLWTDGRYHIQADHQLDCNWILMKEGEHDVSKPSLV